MRGINKVTLIGTLGRDPETKFTNAGNAIAEFSMATSESWKDKGSGERKERTEWHNFVAFGRLAEVAGQYLRKGSRAYIEGTLRTDSWERDGTKHYRTKINVRELQMLDSRRDGGAPPADRPGQPTRQTEPNGGNFPDDEIPF